MSLGRQAQAAAAVALAAASCAPRAAPTRVDEARPPDGVAAVGGRWIGARAVASAAHASGIPAERALERIVRDELLASGARDAGLDASAEVRLAVDALLARALLGSIDAEVRAAPPTDAEVAAAVERRWLELDRPESFRTVHVVVRVTPSAAPAAHAAAKALRDELRAAVSDAARRAKETAPSPRAVPWASAEAPDPAAAAFIEATKRFSTRGELVAQELAPVTADGWTIAAESGTYEAPYAKASAGLASRGDLADADTVHGYHVIMLLERVPAARVLGDARTRAVWRDVVSSRARARIDALTRGGRSPAPELPANVDALIALATGRK